MILKRALFIQIKMLGDILMLTPSIKAFKKKYPESELDVLVEPPGDALLRRNPYVENVIIARTKKWYSFAKQISMIRTLRRRKYDLAVDFLGNPRSAHYTFLSAAKTRVGYDDARFKYAYTHTYKRAYDYSALSKLKFLSFLDIDQSEYRPEFYLDEDIRLPDEIKALSGKKLAAISPVSLRESNVWPVANFAEISEYLFHQFDLHPVVIAGPGEKRFLDDFAGHARVPHTPLLIEDLMLLGAVLKRCDIFCGNDNGPRHVAVAMGLPTFTIHSRRRLSDPNNWNYPDLARHQYIGGINQPDSPEITQILPAMVIVRLGPFVENIFKNRQSDNINI